MKISALKQSRLNDSLLNANTYFLVYIQNRLCDNIKISTPALKATLRSIKIMIYSEN